MLTGTGLQSSDTIGNEFDGVALKDFYYIEIISGLKSVMDKPYFTFITLFDNMVGTSLLVAIILKL